MHRQPRQRASPPRTPRRAARRSARTASRQAPRHAPGRRFSHSVHSSVRVRFSPVARPKAFKRVSVAQIPTTTSFSSRRDFVTSSNYSLFQTLTRVDPSTKRIPLASEHSFGMLAQAKSKLSAPLQTISSASFASSTASASSRQHPAFQTVSSTRFTPTARQRFTSEQMLTNAMMFTIPARHMATKKAPPKKAPGGAPEDEDPSDALFMSAGDVKKQLRGWLEQVFTSTPEIAPLPAAAKANEELFVQECQQRFAKRLDRRTRYEQAKIIVKQRAIEALPGELKTEALKDDESLWSMQIIQPWSHPPRKKWLYEHFGIPYKPSLEELEHEEFMKKKYARF